MSVKQWAVQLPFVKPPLSSNQRMHWAKKARVTREIREGAALAIRAAGVPRCAKVRVRVLWAVSDPKRRRDPSNVMPTQKAVVDGMVDAGVVPDDTPEFVVEEMPALFAVDKGCEGVIFQVIGEVK